MARLLGGDDHEEQHQHGFGNPKDLPPPQYAEAVSAPPTPHYQQAMNVQGRKDSPSSCDEVEEDEVPSSIFL